MRGRRLCLWGSVAVAWQWVGLGCSHPTDVPAPQAPVPQVSPVSFHDPAGWEIHEQKSNDGAVKVTQTEMPPSERERIRQDYRQTALIAIPVEPRFNASVFRIDNVPDWANTAFIAPRVFAYGSSQGGRVAPEHHPDGTVSLSFPVALIDGTESSLESPTDGFRVSVPASLQIRDVDGLRADLRNRFGRSMALAPLPGCPKRLLLKINDREIDATPTDLQSADYCQANKPFNVTVRLPEGDARYLLEDALYANAVEIRATFETRVSFVSSRASVRFEKASLFHDLEGDVGAKLGILAEAEARLKARNLVRERALSIEIQGDVAPIVQSVADQVIRELFAPVPAGTEGAPPECKGATLCLRLNYGYSRENDSFEFKWVQTSTALTGQTYLTWARLSPVLDKEISVGTLSNSQKNGLETGLTVLPGDLLEISPGALTVERRELGVPKTETTHAIVCAETQPAHDEPFCHRQCHRQEGCEIECGLRRVPAHCSRLEDHWIARTTYCSSAPRMVSVDQPFGALEEVFDGLALRFVWRQGTSGALKEMTCPLNAFDRSGDGRSVVVRMENRASCAVFDAHDAGAAPMLYLVNRIDYPSAYRDGVETHFWNGTSASTVVEKVFHPEVRFSGTVRIRGYGFGTSASHAVIK